MINNKSVQNPYELSYIMKRQLQKRISTLVFFVVFTIAAIFFVKTFLLFSFIPQTNAVFSVTENKDRVFVSPFLKPLNTLIPSSVKISHGDLVLVNTSKTKDIGQIKKITKTLVSFFTLNKIELFTEHPRAFSNSSLLRVLACPGDSLYIKDFIVYVKDKNSQFFLTEFEMSKKDYEIQKELGVVDESHPLYIALGNMETIVLAENEYFLLSDNRLANLDSRLWGPVDAKNIKGKALFRVQLFKDASFL